MILKYPDLTQNITTNEDLANLEIYLETELAAKKITMLEWEEIYDEATENVKLKRKEKMLNIVQHDIEESLDKKHLRNKGVKKNKS